MDEARRQYSDFEGGSGQAMCRRKRTIHTDQHKGMVYSGNGDDGGRIGRWNIQQPGVTACILDKVDVNFKNSR